MVIYRASFRFLGMKYFTEDGNRGWFLKLNSYCLCKKLWIIRFVFLRFLRHRISWMILWDVWRRNRCICSVNPLNLSEMIVSELKFRVKYFQFRVKWKNLWDVLGFVREMLGFERCWNFKNEDSEFYGWKTED